MPPINNIPKYIDLIKSDKLLDAYNAVKNATDWNINHSISCLVQLQLLLHKSSTNSGNSSIKSTSRDVFILAEFLCSSVKQHDYECNVSKLITCIYFIVKYFIENDRVTYAKKLSEYIIDLRKENTVFEKKDEVVLRSIYRLFLGALSEMSFASNIDEITHSNIPDRFVLTDSSLIDLWKFIVDFQKFDKGIMITDFIIFLGKCLTKLYPSNRNIIKFIHGDCLKYLVESLKSEKYCIPPELNVAVTNALTLFLVSVVAIVNSHRFSDLVVVLDSVKYLSDLVNSNNHKNCFKLLENFMIFLYFHFVEPSKRIVVYEGVDINAVLTDLCVLLKKLSFMDADIFSAIYDLILHLLSKIQFWQKDSPCKINFPQDTYGNLFEFLFTVTDYKHNVIKLEDCESTVNKNEKIIKNVHLLFNVYVLFEDLFRYLSKNDNLKRIVHQHLKSARRVIQDCTCLINALLKSSSSFDEKYLSFFFNICSNIVNIYFILELFDQCCSLAKQLCEFLISLPEADYLKISKKCLVCNAFVTYTYCCGKLGKSLDGLIAITAWSVAQSSNKFNEKLIGFWTSVKLSHNCSSDIMGLTVCDIAKEHAKVLVKDWGISRSSLRCTDWSSFLLLEIKAYYGRSSLKGETLTNAFRSLLSVNPPGDRANNRFLKNYVIVAESLIYVIDVAIKHISTSEMDDDIKLAFDQVIEKLMKKKKRTVRESCILGNLLHYKVRYDICSRRKNFENKFLNCTVQKLPLEIDRITGLAVDPRDSFDAGIIDSAILFAKQDLFMQELSSGLQLIKEALIQQNDYYAIGVDEDKDDLANLISSELILISLSNVTCTAELYGLYCESKSAADAWDLLFDLCRIKHPNTALIALSNLLDFTHSKDCGDMLFKKAASLGYRSISEFKSSNSLNFESLSDEEMLFFIRLARHNLMYFNNEMDCEKILNAVSGKSNFKTNLTYVQFLKTVCEFLALPGERTWNGEPCKISRAINELYSTLCYIVHNSIWKDFSECISLNRLLLEASLIVGHFFYSMAFPRKAHFYLKEQLKVAQKLTLPIWTCRLLVSLCWVDINVLKLDDCELKLRNLEAILGLDSKNDDFVGSDDIFLDGPSSYNNEDAYDDSGSPVLQKHETKLFYSGVSCVLENPVSACVFIDLITLKAVMFIARGKYDKAIAMFQYGLKIINKAENDQYSNFPISFWIAVRKAVLLFYHGGLVDEKNEYDKALEYYERAFQYFDESSAHLYVHPLANNFHFTVQNSIMKLKFQQFFTDVSSPVGQESISKAMASLSLQSCSENVQRTPTVKSKIPLQLKSSGKNIDKAGLSPGDIPGNPAIRTKLFSDNSDDDCVSDSPVPSKLIPPTNTQNRTKKNKGVVGATAGRACKPFKLFCDNDSDENGNERDKVKTRSKLPQATYSKTKPVRSTKKNQKK